jgi:hypothetical protein
MSTRPGVCRLQVLPVTHVGPGKESGNPSTLTPLSMPPARPLGLLQHTWALLALPVGIPGPELDGQNNYSSRVPRAGWLSYFISYLTRWSLKLSDI